MRKISKNNFKTGFTLIEVVIVLAIGALIILVVLNAVGSARRNQRDSTRRTEASQVASALEQFAANNNARYPANGDFNNFLTDYEPELENKGWADVAACPADVAQDDFQLVYEPVTTGGGNILSYNLEVCLESGGQVNIQED